MRKHKKEDFGKILRIKPEGWIDDLCISIDAPNSCGLTSNGMHINIGNEAGGVLTLDDIADIRDAMNTHLLKIAKRVE